MRLLPTAFLLLSAVTLAVPSAAAKACTFDQEDLCNLANDLYFNEVFGAQADVGLVVVGLVAASLVLFFLAWFLRALRPHRVLKLAAGDRMKEVEPGTTARFKVQVANLLNHLPVDVFIERPPLPTDWRAEVTAYTLLPSGFRVPREIPDSGSVPLSSAARGANEATVEVKLTSPASAKFEETLDYELRMIPVLRRKLRKRKSKRTRLTVLVTPHVPIVQITSVKHNPERIVPGTPVQTRATLVNKGERAAHDVAVVFSLNGSEVDKKIVPAVDVQGNAEVEFHWVPQVGENRIRVSVAA